MNKNNLFATMKKLVEGNLDIFMEMDEYYDSSDDEVIEAVAKKWMQDEVIEHIENNLRIVPAVELYESFSDDDRMSLTDLILADENGFAHYEFLPKMTSKKLFCIGFSNNSYGSASTENAIDEVIYIDEDGNLFRTLDRRFIFTMGVRKIELIIHEPRPDADWLWCENLLEYPDSIYNENQSFSFWFYNSNKK